MPTLAAWVVLCKWQTASVKSKSPQKQALTDITSVDSMDIGRSMGIGYTEFLTGNSGRVEDDPTSHALQQQVARRLAKR